MSETRHAIEEINDCGLDFADRNGRCFELAWKYQNELYEMGYEDWRTIHGEIFVSVQGAAIFMKHGWLTNGKVVYCPVKNECFTIEYWNEFFKPRNTIEYEYDEFWDEICCEIDADPKDMEERGLLAISLDDGALLPYLGQNME